MFYDFNVEQKIELYKVLRIFYFNKHLHWLSLFLFKLNYNRNDIFNLSIWSPAWVTYLLTVTFFLYYCHTAADSDAYFETTQNHLFTKFWLFLMINNGMNADKTVPWLHSLLFQSEGRPYILNATPSVWFSKTNLALSIFFWWLTEFSLNLHWWKNVTQYIQHQCYFCFGKNPVLFLSMSNGVNSTTTTMLWVLCPKIWQQEHNILKFTSEKYIFPPQKDYMKETWLETGSGLT